MLAVIRISAFYSWLRGVSPFVPRGSYLALLDVAAKRQAKIDRIYHRMKELESIYGHSIAQCKEQHDANTKLLIRCHDQHVADVKLVNELNLRCCRQAQLLRQMRKLTDEAALSMNHVAELS